MVTPDNPRERKITFLMHHRLIFKVTKLQLLLPKHLSTVVKDSLFFMGGGGGIMPPLSNRGKSFLQFDVMNDEINDCIEISAIIAHVSLDIH